MKHRNNFWAFTLYIIKETENFFPCFHKFISGTNEGLGDLETALGTLALMRLHEYALGAWFSDLHEVARLALTLSSGRLVKTNERPGCLTISRVILNSRVVSVTTAILTHPGHKVCVHCILGSNIQAQAFAVELLPSHHWEVATYQVPFVEMATFPA